MEEEEKRFTIWLTHQGASRPLVAITGVLDDGYDVLQTLRDFCRDREVTDEHGIPFHACELLEEAIHNLDIDSREMNSRTLRDTTDPDFPPTHYVAITPRGRFQCWAAEKPREEVVLKVRLSVPEGTAPNPTAGAIRQILKTMPAGGEWRVEGVTAEGEDAHTDAAFDEAVEAALT